MKIIFASLNVGKIKELQALLNNSSFEIVPQADLGIPDVVETGLTFIENALLKARNACQQSGLPAIADDSGLVVDALHGAPGIYSARYAATPQDAIKKLLSEMQNVPETHRQAHFHCTLVYLEHARDPAPLICEGKWYGTLLRAPVGNHGFGYDPVFYDPTQECAAAELPLEKKNQISHRGQALLKLMTQLYERRTG